MELIQDNCSKLDGVKIGAEVTAHVNIKGRAWNDPNKGHTVFFNTIQAWKLDFATVEPIQEEPTIDEGNDLPF